MGKIEEEGEERNDHGELNKVYFHEDGSEVREVSRAGSLDSSSSSSTGTTERNLGDSLSENTPIPHDNKVEIVAPVRTPMRIPPISPSPPMVMERQAGYDPNRIPSTIFATRPSNPAEWSVASNESLFSIQTGNNSFSKEHTAFLLYKSGELTKLDEVFSVPTPLPPVSESMSLQRDSVSSSLAENSSKSPWAEDEPMDHSKCEPSSEGNSPALVMGNSSPPGNARNSVSLSARSDGSLTIASTGSFAFPRLAGSGSKSASVMTSDGERIEQAPAQTTTPTPHPQQQNHRTMVRAGLSNCFSCFSCCKFRWSFLHR